MPEFIEALRTLTFADFLRLLAILTPFIVAIWGAFRWAYGVRLKTLETSLTELRTDFQRNLNREVEKEKLDFNEKNITLQQKIEALRTDIDNRNIKYSEMLSDFTEFHLKAKPVCLESQELKLLWEELDEKYCKHERMTKRRRKVVERGGVWIDPNSVPPAEDD